MHSKSCCSTQVHALLVRILSVPIYFTGLPLACCSHDLQLTYRVIECSVWRKSTSLLAREESDVLTKEYIRFHGSQWLMVGAVALVLLFPWSLCRWARDLEAKKVGAAFGRREGQLTPLHRSLRGCTSVWSWTADCALLKERRLQDWNGGPCVGGRIDDLTNQKKLTRLSEHPFYTSFVTKSRTSTSIPLDGTCSLGQSRPLPCLLLIIIWGQCRICLGC